MGMKAIWGTVLAGFIVFSFYTMVTNELSDLIDFMLNPGIWGVAAIVDLLIALTIGVYFMWKDARARGISPLPYALLSVVAGSAGLLTYLVIHGNSLGEYTEDEKNS